jgi:hypothetical protein
MWRVSIARQPATATAMAHRLHTEDLQRRSIAKMWATHNRGMEKVFRQAAQEKRHSVHGEFFSHNSSLFFSRRILIFFHRQEFSAADSFFPLAFRRRTIAPLENSMVRQMVHRNVLPTK